MATKPKAVTPEAKQPLPGTGAENTNPPTAGTESPQPGAGEEGGEQQPLPGAGAEEPKPKPKEPKTTKADRISESLRAIGRDVLDRNPQFKAVYVTANGYVFPVECDALNHAKSLKNKNVVPVIR